MTEPLDLAAIERRRHAAYTSKAAAAQLAAEDVPALVARVRALEAVAAAARVLFDNASPWVRHPDYVDPYCVACEMWRYDGHAADCAWDVLHGVLMDAEDAG